ncbi:MAG: hypothetical protein ACRC8A_17580 [Microcoleaceae cyanobacterium]
MSLNELYSQLNLVILEIEQHDRKNLPKYSSQFSEQVKLRKLARMFERLAAIAEEKADNLQDIDLDDSFLFEANDLVIDLPLVASVYQLGQNTQGKNGALVRSNQT